MSYANGDVYVGDWKDSAPHGNGVMTYAYGDRYEGQFVRAFPTAGVNIHMRMVVFIEGST